MKITIIHGQNHKGSTYHIARMVADRIGGEIKEFFLPRDFGSFCMGCMMCFKGSEAGCPHHASLAPITKALLEADLIILASPVYVYHATGSMKALLDHYGYMWMVHRPEQAMFSKQGLCVATAAGAGMSSTIKDMADSLFFWGVAKRYKLGFAVAAVSWDAVSEKKKLSIEKKAVAMADLIKRRNGRVKPGFKTKAFFGLVRMLHKKGLLPGDMDYWNKKGWDGKIRPWK
ncbi:MAG: NAD(P)H-dependent oxidoreductase [Treponema sp.]|nr:NAD(P)H-dependent oxidoreductase [Treponema sp.]